MCKCTLCTFTKCSSIPKLNIYIDELTGTNETAIALIADGISETGAHVWTELGYSIW